MTVHSALFPVLFAPHALSMTTADTLRIEGTNTLKRLRV
jgi:hypothetical protein